jgi:DNA-directed RNA polymerase specialized sigma24 family protein
MENLTERVLQYQRTRQGLREIVDEISPRVYQFPRRTMGWDEDACGDFYVFIHPRLIRLVDRFRDQGKPFESYLWAVLSWQLRNFARDRSRGERRWNVSLRMEPGPGVSADDQSRVSDAADVNTDALDASAAIARHLRSPADRRNFLFLALKCSRLIDPENAPALARAAGITVGTLMDHVEALREMRRARENRHEMLRCRRNNAFAAIRLLETELRDQRDPEKRASAEKARARARLRMSTSMTRMARVGLAPTNREISRVLGVPKGTVDSGLYWLKRKLAAVYDPDHLRSA